MRLLDFFIRNKATSSDPLPRKAYAYLGSHFVCPACQDSRLQSDGWMQELSLERHGSSPLIIRLRCKDTDENQRDEVMVDVLIIICLNAGLPPRKILDELGVRHPRGVGHRHGRPHGPVEKAQQAAQSYVRP